MNLDVTADFAGFSKYLRTFQRKHLPSIYRNTLNGIAFEAQRELKKNLPKQVENPTPYTLSGIQVEKTDKNKLESKVGYVSQTFGKKKAGAGILPAEYMSRLNTGGIRIPQKKVIAVPVLKNYRPNKFGNIKRNDISKFLSDDKKYFVGPPRGAKHPGGYGIFKRMGRGGRKNIAMLVAFKDDTKYFKTYNFGQVIRAKTRKVMKKEFAKHFKEVLIKKGAFTRFTTM
jgi:hypothetical protein